MRLKTLVLVLAAAALCAVLLAPAAFGSAGVKMKLKGPSDAPDGSVIKLTLTISNPQRADGMAAAAILQNKDGKLVRIGSKAIAWTNGGRTGTVVFKVEATPTAMGIAKYRAAWTHPLGTSRSNAWSVELD
jgi:hypothetical protein